jgi:predicted ester cyclase
MKNVLDRVMNEVVARGNLDVVDEVYKVSAVWHGPGVDLRGREGFKQLYGDFRKAFPGRSYEYELMLFTKDCIVGRWVLRGVQKGPIMGVAPTGKVIRTTGITIHRFEDGQIAEEWEEFDGLGMLRQLGALPPGRSL